MKSDFILRTTINLNADMLNKLKEKCSEYKVNLHELIKEALRCYIKENEKIKDLWCTVSYQQKGVKYKKLHFKMTAREYETYLDFKKFHRLSFSFIVALALEKFADLIILGEVKDSYPISGYTKVYIKKENYTFLILCWGVPTKPMILEIFEE
jgi:hypothetical protein